METTFNVIEVKYPFVYLNTNKQVYELDLKIAETKVSNQYCSFIKRLFCDGKFHDLIRVSAENDISKLSKGMKINANISLDHWKTKDSFGILMKLTNWSEFVEENLFVGNDSDSESDDYRFLEKK